MLHASAEFAEINQEKFAQLLQEIQELTPNNIPTEMNELLLRAQELRQDEQLQHVLQLIFVIFGTAAFITAGFDISSRPRSPEHTALLMLMATLFVITVWTGVATLTKIPEPRHKNLDVALAASGVTDNPEVELSHADTSALAQKLLAAGGHLTNHLAPRAPENPWREKRKRKQAQQNNFDHLYTSAELRQRRRQENLDRYPRLPLTR